MSEALDKLKLETKKIVLDFAKTNYVTVAAKQYDKASRYINVQFANNGQQIVLNPNFEVQIKMLTPDNRAILETVPIQSDGTLLLELTESMLYYSGKCEAEIRIYDKQESNKTNGTIRLISTMNFNILVSASPYSDDRIIDSDEFNALTKLYSELTGLFNEAEASANAAKKSETNAKTSEKNAKTSETNAANSATTSINKANDASISATNAAKSEDNAKKSEINAKISKDNAKTSEANANISEDNAKISEDNAKTHMDIAIQKASEAKDSEEIAIAKATDAANSATFAETSATNAANSAQSVLDMANISKSYAVGSNGEVREGDDTDNAQYYYEQSKRIAQGVTGVVYMGTVTFEDLSNPDNQQPNYMFNISEAFTTDDTFKEGAGHTYGAGVNVCRTADGYWDALVGSTVTGIKGNAETSFRTGNVNITAKDIGIPNPEVVSDDEPSDQETGAFWMKAY